MGQNDYILVISQQNESSTDKTLQYLLHYSSDFIRINIEDNIKTGQISFDDN